MFSSNNGLLWRAEETWSGWVKRGWSAEWLCIIVVGMVIPRTPVPPSGLNSNADSVHKLATVASFSILIATWDCFPKKRPLPCLANPSPCAVYKKAWCSRLLCVVVAAPSEWAQSTWSWLFYTCACMSVLSSFLCRPGRFHGLSHAGFGGLELFVSCLHSEFWTLVHIIYTSESPVTIQTWERQGCMCFFANLHPPCFGRSVLYQNNESLSGSWTLLRAL